MPTNGKPLREFFSHRFKRILHKQLHLAEDKASEEHQLYYFDQGEQSDSRNQEHAKRILLEARARVVGAYLEAVQRQRTVLPKEYHDELQFLRRDWFPRQWMKRHRGINNVFRRYPKTAPFLNYIHNLTRWSWDAEDLSAIKTQNARVIGILHQDKYEYTTFCTDRRFYEEACGVLDCSKVYVRRYLRAFVESGVWPRWRAGRYWLYADGYFTPMRKVPFLINSAQGRALLLGLERWLL